MPLPPPSPKIQSDLRRGNRFGIIGDSIARGNTQNALNLLGSNSWFTHLCFASGQRLRHGRNAGVSSDTTTQMLARIQADIFAYDLTHLIIAGGTNDLGAAVPLATVQGNLATMASMARARKMQPIMVTLLPRQDGLQTQVATLNAWIRAYAQAHGYPLLDFFTQAQNPLSGTGVMRSGYSVDTVHPVPTFGRDLGIYAATTLLNEVPPWTPYLTMSADDPINLITAGTFNTDANADGVADGWIADAAGGTVTYSRFADSAYGYRQRLQYTGAGSRALSQVISGSKWSVGNKLAFSGRIWFTVEAGALLPLITVTFVNGAEPARIRPCDGVYATDLTNAVFYLEGVVPIGTTQVQVIVTNSGGTGTGTIDVAQMTLLNLTTLGLA